MANRGSAESITYRPDAVDVSGSAYNALGSIALPSEDVDYCLPCFDVGSAALRAEGMLFGEGVGYPHTPKPLGTSGERVKPPYPHAQDSVMHKGITQAYSWDGEAMLAIWIDESIEEFDRVLRFGNSAEGR